MNTPNSCSLLERVIVARLWSKFSNPSNTDAVGCSYYWVLLSTPTRLFNPYLCAEAARECHILTLMIKKNKRNEIRWTINSQNYHKMHGSLYSIDIDHTSLYKFMFRSGKNSVHFDHFDVFRPILANTNLYWCVSVCISWYKILIF